MLSLGLPVAPTSASPYDEGICLRRDEGGGEAQSTLERSHG